MDHQPTDLHEVDTDTDSADGGDYWDGLIGERAAAAFLGVSDRTMQVWRQRGGGPQFIRLSSRCVKYRRRDLRAWADSRVRSSTTDRGGDHAPAAA